MNNHPPRTPDRPPHSVYYRWELLLLLFFTYFLHQADRAIFGIVLPSIKTDLKLTDTQIGASGTVLFLVLAVMVPVGGMLGDRLSKKWIITGSLIFWSISTMLTGVSRGLAGLIAFRSVATGGGESFYGPASTALIAAFHKKTRALALSIHQSSLYIGIMVSGFLAAWVSQQFGWRSTFYIFGGCGILLGGVLVFRLRDPRAGETEISAQQESARPLPPLPPLPPLEAVRTLVRIPTALLLTVGFTAIVFVNNAYLVWAPMFIGAKFGVPEITAGGFSMFYHHLAALFGVLIGGAVADAVVPRRPRFRLQLQATAMLCGVPLIFLIGRVNSLAAIWIVIALFGFVRGLYESNTHAAMFDVVPPQLRSTVVGLMIMCAFLIGSLSPLLLGMLGDRHGTASGLGVGFSGLSLAWLIGGLCIVAALVFTYNRDRLKNT
jgi:sugar phosphate permease